MVSYSWMVRVTPCAALVICHHNLRELATTYQHEVHQPANRFKITHSPWQVTNLKSYSVATDEHLFVL